MLFNMERTERGSSFQIKDLDFESGEATLIGNYDSVLTDYAMMFRNHPEVNFLVKGYVQSYGVNAEVEYRHNRALSFFLKMDNLAFQRYYFWANYPSQRGLFILGLTYTIPHK